jgi:DNA-binding transcriptional ArsR family regulator
MPDESGRKSRESARVQRGAEIPPPIYPRQRRPPTALEAKALAHPLRQKIVRIAGQENLTNKQISDRLGSDPGTVFPHVRMLVEAGFLEPAEVRTGTSGALEKPYRSTGRTWWLDDPLAEAGPELRFGPVDIAMEEARAAGPDAISTFATFTLHLSQEEVAELDRRILIVLDEYIETDPDRLDRPVQLGFFVMHRTASAEAEYPADDG